MKRKVWNLTVLDNPNRADAGENDIFYTTDTEAFLIFRVTDEDFNPTTAMMTLVNTSDKSVISETVPVTNKEIQWEMTEEAIEHSGNWQGQLVYIQERSGKPERYTAPVVQFDIKSHLLTGRKPGLVAIEDWDTFIVNAREFMNQLEDEADGLFIDIDELEQQYRDNEQERADSENVREANESARQADENQRESRESIRVDNEQQREVNESLRESSETNRVSAEQSRITAEDKRNDLYDLVQQKLANGEFVGEKGDTGDGLEYIWNGTRLGVRKEGDTAYTYVDLKGEKGDTGEIETLNSTHIEEALGYSPLDSTDLTWDNLSDKPTTFTPATHSHSWAQVTGKPSTFTPADHSHSWDTITDRPDRYSPSAHGHPWGEITDKPSTFPSSWTQVTGKPSTFTPAAHSHSWTQVTGKPSTFPAATHTHSWNAITDQPSTYSPSTHGHPWGEITGKPSTFTPSSHTHTIANVSGLQTALNGKASTSVATTSSAGLMSAADKSKLNGLSSDATTLNGLDAADFLRIIYHGLNKNEPRPMIKTEEGSMFSFSVLWLGRNEPSNAVDNDIWIGGPHGLNYKLNGFWVEDGL